MATHAQGADRGARVGRGFLADQPFFTRYAVVLALIILFGFAQFEMRGFVDIRAAPAFLHLHGAIMVSWLALTVAQNLIIQKPNVQLHRTVGWVGSGLAAAVVVMGAYTGRQAIIRHMAPPFFTTPQFLALTQVEAIAFGLLVILAILKRRETQAHRRFMLISTIQIVEPAFGRILPMPLLGGWGEWMILGIQLVMLGVLARHDRKVLGAVNRATVTGGAIVVGSHVMITALSSIPAFAAYANALAAG